jgi:gamma-glutamylputrescine oxidase
MIRPRYPIGSDGYPVANYVLAEDTTRPQFRSDVGPDQDGKTAIIIIGAGYTGLAAALRLAELRAAGAPFGRILLLERDRVASGPSGRSAGHICGLQAPDEAVRRWCGPVLATQLIGAAAQASNLVRELIARHAIPCDLRDGYVSIAPDGSQSISEGGLEFGIAPYPFALGLAFAAEASGVEIYEHATVTDLTATKTGVAVAMGRQTILARFVLASGGYSMAEMIPALAPLRRRTTELMVSTIITEPLPDALLRRIMPGAGGQRFPFANQRANVAYGTIDSSNRLIFGACATAIRDPDLAAIARALDALFPELWPGFLGLTGRALGWRPLVEAETLCFTRKRLPHVGVLGDHANIFYAHALGGHGVAAGTLLGTAAAEKIHALSGGPASEAAGIFDAFASVRHSWLPPWQPWRAMVTGLARIVG